MSVPSHLHPALSKAWLDAGFSVEEFEMLRLKLAHRGGDQVLDIQGALAFKMLGFSAGATAVYFLAGVSPSEAAVWENSRETVKNNKKLTEEVIATNKTWFPTLVASWVEAAKKSHSFAMQQIAHPHIGSLWLCSEKVTSPQQVETLLSGAGHAINTATLNRVLIGAYGNRVAPVNTLGALVKTRDLDSFPIEELRTSGEQALSAAIQLAEDLDTEDLVPEVREALNIGLLLN